MAVYLAQLRHPGVDLSEAALKGNFPDEVDEACDVMSMAIGHASEFRPKWGFHGMPDDMLFERLRLYAQGVPS